MGGENLKESEKFGIVTDGSEYALLFKINFLTQQVFATEINRKPTRE